LFRLGALRAPGSFGWFVEDVGQPSIQVGWAHEVASDANIPSVSKENRRGKVVHIPLMEPSLMLGGSTSNDRRMISSDHLGNTSR
jgi:hypothetical protein